MCRQRKRRIEEADADTAASLLGSSVASIPRIKQKLSVLAGGGQTSRDVKPQRALEVKTGKVRNGKSIKVVLGSTFDERLVVTTKTKLAAKLCNTTKLLSCHRGGNKSRNVSEAARAGAADVPVEL